MYQRASQGGGGAMTEVYAHTAALTSNGWDTGVNLTDVSVFIIYSDSTSRMCFAKNENGTLTKIKEFTNSDTTFSVNTVGHIIMTSTNTTVRNAAATLYGYR